MPWKGNGSTAWLVARTNVPLRQLVFVGAFLSLATPVIVKGIGWILLLGPNNGLVNNLLARAPARARPTALRREAARRFIGCTSVRERGQLCPRESWRRVDHHANEAVRAPSTAVH